MFTGLVRGTGRVVRADGRGGGVALAVDASVLEPAPAVGASVSVSGVCLTVTEVAGAVCTFDVVRETARRSTLGALRPGARVNLEPSLRAGDPLDGHLVLGHVDAVGAVRDIREEPAGRRLRVELPGPIAPLVAEKGSIAVDGISLTVAAVDAGAFEIALIPHTLRMSTLADLAPGARVNLEADVLARYAARVLGAGRGGGLSADTLRRGGFL
jgi:riboflavin synthase